MIQAEKTIMSTCTFCGVGCQVNLHIKDNVIFRVDAPFDVAPNYGMLCFKGRFGTDYVMNPSRLKKPLIRVNRDQPRSVPAQWREASWEEALDFVADNLVRIAREHGGEAIA